MEIFVRRLPNSTTRLDLMQFVNSALKPKWYRLEFAPRGKLAHCDICCIKDPKTKQVEYHGIVQINPPSAAQQVIDRLNGEYFKTKKVEVRKFFRRSDKRDRRQNQKDLPPYILEQRKRDRRRPDLKFDYLHAGTTSDRNLHSAHPLPH